jgi:hypothetical protein
MNMATQLPVDYEVFKDFMKHRFNASSESTLEDGVLAFREYQRQLNDLRAEVQQAREQFARGEYGPFDEEEILREVDERLAAKGIPE